MPPLAQPAPEKEHYPGSSATAASLLALAHEYRAAANLLLNSGRRGQPVSYAPFRLTAIHAMELYLSAFLLASGETALSIRAYGHNLSSREVRVTALGLVLRQGTRRHMAMLSDGREYLVSRYAVELLSSMSQINRVAASLDDIANKVTRRLASPAG
jgi:hypothetical protein